jgi:hypothetical protein
VWRISRVFSDYPVEVESDRRSEWRTAELPSISLEDDYSLEALFIKKNQENLDNTIQLETIETPINRQAELL